MSSEHYLEHRISVTALTWTWTYPCSKITKVTSGDINGSSLTMDNCCLLWTITVKCQYRNDKVELLCFLVSSGYTEKSEQWTARAQMFMVKQGSTFASNVVKSTWKAVKDFRSRNNFCLPMPLEYLTDPADGYLNIINESLTFGATVYVDSVCSS